MTQQMKQMLVTAGWSTFHLPFWIWTVVPQLNDYMIHFMVLGVVLTAAMGYAQYKVGQTAE
ncbi:MAG: hypothetical protein N0C84_00355 [Candidatus Thiodiazotropha taylori]|uniref:Uncharacterized protein n=1 Tax=Candidatus Thiodiazotropha taylori TaxID=2792791 RepID=A0A9E4KA22_9GAMM|nr:hypothetical protein [Candidatus Thiodiazotropha taylori]MCW4254895.1 hypothetical protein [Candidatus Thiodiazotropha taylori]